ncbi:uncharacterized protein EV420DRAFT_477853 [Desarmillaria tabescens]|uniref:Uncharacterized protein n=1 Tax=Armillaria tabescens TaxID=1929756 RepID=A0AA39KDG8_ARMTA|nr:uncharacterized protein EV420DRAFT_477853 [Desarmillaria tabescens]KAK0457779.1 hypothetical protein EV420DRAFT_477853 [Desarmillaria tabescens]
MKTLKSMSTPPFSVLLLTLIFSASSSSMDHVLSPMSFVVDYRLDFIFEIVCLFLTWKPYSHRFWSTSPRLHGIPSELQMEPSWVRNTEEDLRHRHHLAQLPKGSQRIVVQDQSRPRVLRHRCRLDRLLVVLQPPPLTFRHRSLFELQMSSCRMVDLQ